MAKRDGCTRTIPWAEHEFCLVNGVKCVYDQIMRTHEGMYIRIPGHNKPVTVERLRQKGFDVVITKQAKKEWTA